MLSKQKIGFVGTGVMGKNMAKHLQQAGHPVHIYTRTKSKAKELIYNGATWHESISSLASSSEVIITMVGYPNDVEEIYFGENGIIENTQPNTYVIDMTTSKPTLAEEIAKKAIEKDIHALDAPVSGGDIGARDANLSIMVGGAKADYEEMLPIFELMGKTIHLHGKAGSGQHTKMCNQITNALNMIGVCEAIIYAKKAGLDPIKMIDTVKSGAAGSWALANLGPRILKEDYAPGFYVKHFIKDMTIALETAKELEIHVPGLELALQLYEELSEMGEGDSGTQALMKYFERA